MPAVGTLNLLLVNEGVVVGVRAVGVVPELRYSQAGIPLRFPVVGARIFLADIQGFLTPLKVGFAQQYVCVHVFLIKKAQRMLGSVLGLYQEKGEVVISRTASETT